MDKIYLHGIQAQTLIGAYEWERQQAQAIVIDLDIALPDKRAGHSDQLQDTINYASVLDRLHSFLASQQCLLLEALAERLAQDILQHFQAPWVRISLAKPGILVGVRQVGVCITRTKPQALGLRDDVD